MMPPLQATLPITSSANMDTDSLPKNYRAVTLRISVGRMLTAQRAIQAAYPRAGGPVMTLGILHALKGQRSVEDLLRALPSALRPLLAFDRVSLALDRSVSGALWWHGLDAECAISRTDDEVPADLTALGLLSTCAVPLTTPHRALGTLEIASRRANAYSDDDVDLLAIVADAVAVTLDNALSHEQLREEHDRSTLLLELTNSLVSNLELRDFLTAVMRSARRIMRSDSAVVALPDADAGHLRAYALDIQDGGDLLQEGELIDAQGTIAAQVFRTGKPWVGRIEDVLESGLEVNPKWLELGFKVGCVLPLASRHRILGTLGLRRRDDTMYTDDEVNFLIQVANQIAVAVENALAYGEIRSLKDKLAEERVYLRDEVRTERNFEEVVGKSTVLRRVLRNVETVAPTDSTVLIYGETGTGKELVARAINNLSPRRSKAFVKLNCAAIPTGLLESELFGHERGAFTGAIAQRIGRFEVAHGGTIFLDEIGEIPLELQTKLLRVLQEREFERLGSSRTLRTDARLIAATNRDLEAMVAEQKFRSDLFFRLNVFPIQVPPLRERHGYIPLLVRHFAQQFSKRMNKTIDTISSATTEALSRYHWPGNIRELQNVIERAVITSTGRVLKVDVADLKISKPSSPAEKGSAQGSTNGGLRDTLEETERQQILKALQRSNWVVAGPKGAAAKLGMKRSTLQLRMSKLGISRHSS